MTELEKILKQLELGGYTTAKELDTLLRKKLQLEQLDEIGKMKKISVKKPIKKKELPSSIKDMEYIDRSDDSELPTEL